MANEEFTINTPAGIQAYMAGPRFPGIHVIRSNEGVVKMAVRSEGVIRGGDDAGQDKAIAVSDAGDQFAIAAAAPYAELTRLGGGYSFIATAATNALVVRPSTVAQVTLWNGEGEDGKSYVIDRLFTHQLVSGTAEARFGIWACIHPAGMTDPGEDIAASASNVTGNSGKVYNGNAVVGVGETIINNGWYPWGPSVSAEPTGLLPGAQMSVDVEGRLIIPPQGGISLHVVTSSVNEDFTIGCSWYEIQMALT